MKLSIIVPVFNMASDGKLEYCLESLVNQTINDYEIIAVDDCSTDNSLEILKQYEIKYPDKFKVIASPVNKKQGGAKNLGLEIDVPVNYFPDDDDTKDPMVTWRSSANLLYSNWLNYFVYQVTPYNIDEIE